MAIEGQVGIDYFSQYYLLFWKRYNCAIFKDKFNFGGIQNFLEMPHQQRRKCNLYIHRIKLNQE